MWPHKLGTDRETTQAHLVTQVGQAITYPEDFLFRTSDFRGAFKAILDKQRSIYRALNTLCGKHTTSTATMSFHALRPWDQRFVLEAHDAPFVDGTSELLVTNYRALISSGILLDIKWGMSSHSDHHTVVLRAWLDVSANRCGQLMPYFASARKLKTGSKIIVIDLFSTATRYHEHLNHVLSNGIFHRADPHTVYSKKHLLEQLAIYDMVFAATTLMKNALKMSTPQDKPSTDRKRAVYIEEQIIKRNLVNPTATDKESQKYWSSYHAQSAEKTASKQSADKEEKPLRIPSPSEQAATVQTNKKNVLSLVYR
jgi:hypothetical protein